MRVGLVCPYDLARPGGVQAQVLGLADALRARGGDVRVIGPGLPESIDGVDLGPTVTVPGNRSRAPISLHPRLPKLLREAVRDLDLLHVHEPLMPMVSLSALRAGPPVAATFHADPSRMIRWAYAAAGGRIRTVLGPRVKAITAVSPTAAGALPDDLGAVVVPNGIDVSAMRAPAGRDERLVVFLGRDEPRKGLDVLLGAWDRIAGAAPGARLTVMGADRGTPGVDWLGPVDDAAKRRVLNQAAVFVAPHTGGESFGIVLIEAMACGAAVVASDLPAFRDVAASAARFFPVRDSAALVEAVTEVLSDRSAREGMAARGGARAAEFDWGAVAPAYTEVYSAALRSEGRS